MSLAWKCDICGVLYESDKDGYTNFIKLGRINDYCKTDDESMSFFHICPSCNLKALSYLRKEHNRNKTEEHALYVMTKGGEG